MDLLRTAVTNIWELLVEDGWIAAGTLLAFLAVGAWSLVAGPDQHRRDFGGPLLFVLLMLLLLSNLYAAGRRATRRRQELG